MSIKYDFGIGYITNIPQNWVVAVDKTNSKTGEKFREILGFFPTLAGAKRGAVRIFGTVAETHEELNNLVDKILQLEENYDEQDFLENTKKQNETNS